MKIKNLNKVKELIKAKLPEYLQSLDITIDNNKVQCPNSDAHKHADKGKLSAAYLPKTNNTLLWCFVEDRKFDIFDIYSIKEGKDITGQKFLDAIKDLAKRFGIPLDIEETYSPKQRAEDKKREVMEEIHRRSLKSIKYGTAFYKERGIGRQKVQFFKIGFISPDLITKELNEKFKTLFEYSLKGVLTHPALVIPVLNENQQYAGLILRQFGCDANDRYLNFSIEGKNLFNVNNIRGNDNLYIVEGVFDAIALYPNINVVGALTNSIHDKDLECIAKKNFQKITIALDQDNWKQGLKRDGILKTILKLKNLDTEIQVVELPENADPDSYVQDNSLSDFKSLKTISALDYLVENFNEKIIKIEEIYKFISGCPNIVKKEALTQKLCTKLNLGKRQVVRAIDSIEDTKENINLVAYAEEKDQYSNMLEEFTESAWSKKFQGIKTGFPMFDANIGGFEDTLYLYVGFPEMGKTTFLLNFAYQLAQMDGTFVAFYSLDDGAQRAIIPRLMSMVSGLSSKDIREPTPDMQKQWERAMKRMQAMKDSLVIKDGSHIRTVSDLDKYVNLHYNIAQEKERKFIIVIDNLHALCSSARFEANENTQRIAAYLKRVPQAMHCPIISTAEVPKSASKVPEGKDIKESIDIWYASRFVGGVMSAAHQKGGSSHLVWKPKEGNPDGKYMPIIQLYVSKNQTGKLWHGNLYYKMNWSNNRLTECSSEETKILNDSQSILT